jgi:hypothetical protein
LGAKKERYDEIDRFISDSMIPPDRFAVYVTETDCHNDLGLGRSSTDKAQVLFTTKAQIKIRSKGKSFNEMEIFHYNGISRQVRIWDESLCFGKGLTLRRTALGSLFKPIEDSRQLQLLQQVEELSDRLKDCSNFDVIQIPDFGMSFNEGMSLFINQSPELRDIAETLFLMADKPVTVRKSDKGLILLDCVEELPPDFLPCLVTDASGRVRHTYRLHDLERHNLKRLKSAKKHYTNLNVYVWRTAGGRNSFDRERTKNTAKEIAKVINNHPAEEFLIIYHKPKDIYGNDNLPEFILKETITDKDRIKFVNYGRHTSTNEFADIPNIIMAGTHFYKVAEYEALGRAEANRPTAKGEFTNEEMKQVKLGESAHHLLQAACRGLIRKCNGDTCYKSNLWLIVDPRTGIETMLPEIFPGCDVKTWNTATPSLSGKREEAFNFIKMQVVNGNTAITVKQVRKAVEIRDNPAFKRDVLKQDFLQAISELGFILKGQGRGMKFVKPEFNLSFDKEA